MAEQDVQQGFDEIRKLFRETDEKLARELRERDERLDEELRKRDERMDQFHQEMVEGFRELRELFQETDRRFQETDRRFQETDRKFNETDRKFQETDQQFNETDKKIRELANLFTGQWGKLMEALVRPGVKELFQERGIKITGVSPRRQRQRNGNQMEIDLLLENDDAVVVIEVKTTLKTDDVRGFLGQLDRVQEFFPEYEGKQLYGAVAGLDIDEAVDRFAYQRGLFVLKIEGDSMAKILNDLKFKPKDFSKTD